MIRGFASGVSWRGAVLGLCVLSLTGILEAKDRDALPETRAQMDVAINKVRPALVRIRVVSAEFGDGREIKVQEVGSGAIITKDGFIITNHHVAGHATRMFCTLWNREEVEAELIGTDPLTDIAIIKLKPESPREFTPATFGDSTTLRVGDAVLAMGSPMALSQSVTLGILSNTEMIMPRFWGSQGRLQLDGEDVGALVRWIGHDAAIYGGNSGGPLVNLRGEIIGINEISFGLGGAIPGNLAKAVAAELMAKGKIQRSWLGLDAQPLFKHSKDNHGLLIAGVMSDSPAERSGLAAGDLLLRLDGQPTDVRFDEQMPEFMRRVTSLPVGKEVSAVVRRGGQEITLHLTPAERGEIYPKQQELKPWGLTVRNISLLIAREMKRSNREGIFVTSVRPGGPAGAAKPSLEPRDVILAVNATPVKNIQELVEATHQLTAGKSEPVPALVTFERKAARFLAVVKVGIEDLKDPGLEVTKAWLPVETQVISREIAKQMGDPALKGFHVTRVYPGTTAEKAGLLAGDFILAVDGEKLTASGPEFEDELSALIRQYDVGKTVELVVLRDKASRKIPVELARSPRLAREMKKYRSDDFEFTVRDVSFFDAATEQWSAGQRGALVEEIKSGSWAELAGLNVGDLILEVDGQAVANVDDLRRQIERVSGARKAVVVMKILRGIHTAFLEMEPNWKN